VSLVQRGLAGLPQSAPGHLGPIGRMYDFNNDHLAMRPVMARLIAGTSTGAVGPRAPVMDGTAANGFLWTATRRAIYLTLQQTGDQDVGSVAPV